MGIFNRRKTREAGARLPAGDPLAAVPRVAEGVEARPDARDRVQLRKRWRPATGVRGFLARVLKYEHTSRLDLDEMGSDYWRLVDGRRTLAAIAARLAERRGLGEDECRKAALRFTRSLMLRHFVDLEVRGR